MSGSKENANGGNCDELNFSIGETVSGFKLVKKIDEGGFGQVFKVTRDDKTFYAMKLESSFQGGGSAIKLEINVLQQLPKDTVFPELISGGRKPRFHYLVLELLGDNLKMLKSRSPNPDVWTDGTWSRIGIQCLYAIKVMHDSGFVHRDIKPNNFAIGLNTISELRSRRVLLFDFGLARKFVRKLPPADLGISKKTDAAVSKNGASKLKTKQVKPSGEKGSKVKKTRSKHVNTEDVLRKNQMKVQMKMKKLRGPKAADNSQRTAEEKPDEDEYAFRIPRPHTDFRGTHQYASPNAHLQKELGRHDDIWSLMYMVAEFFVELPWTNNEDLPVDELKDQSSLLRLFIDEKNPNRLTQEMRRQLNEIDKMLKSMNYYTHPNYELVYQFLKDSMDKSKVSWDSPFDWELSGQSELEKTIKQPKKKNFYWENPKSFFKNSRWVELKMPSLSPPVSSKNSSASKARSVSGYKKADYKARGRGPMSKEDSADGEDVLAKAPTPAQKSSRKEPDVISVESKKQI
ncbi:Protein CBG02852 [Caenorhabditis briggsae]|uniref:Protein CBG02852 n=2 Tax=Caenorhabditis briggsae TaxID=6238 RepID=A8WTD7_CAEBR|nr:Protein CBG02852 [Caenorhabditis briggsae]ULU06226.1 hypothetical protein L3Y34_018237 [Caenorhabditis briggsae]CAP23748.1 Protein CBG02852 [Caenorhabditis briggsae]